MADRPELEPVAHAISYDGSTPDRLWLDGDGPLLDLEVARQGGTATKLLLYTDAQLAAEVAKDRAEERSRYTALVDWLQDVGLLKAEHCQIDKPETLGYWWVLRKPYLIGQHVSYGETEDEAIAAAIRQASEPTNL